MSGKRSTVLLKGFLMSHKDFSIESVSRRKRRGRGRREGKKRTEKKLYFSARSIQSVGLNEHQTDGRRE